MKKYSLFYSFAIVALVLSVLPFSHSGQFYAPSEGYLHQINITNTSSGNKTVNVNITKLDINASENYLKTLFGESYYSKYINYSEYFIYNGNTSILFNYNVPFINGSVIKPIYSGSTEPIQLLRLLNIEVIFGKNNSVISYVGPVKPYFIDITQSEAQKIASEYGFNGTINGIFGVYSNKNNNTNYNASERNLTYYLVWKVVNSTPYYPTIINTSSYYTKLYKGIYIDAQNGSVDGEFFYNPAQIVPLETKTISGVAGSFTLFPINKENSTAVNSNNNSNGNQGEYNTILYFNPDYAAMVYVGVFAVIIVVLFFVIFRHKMHHHKNSTTVKSRRR
ncbi:MAG: hypothetical protein ACP5M9_00755 [Candidatus Micrarchaeia archaeon]